MSDNINCWVAARDSLVERGLILYDDETGMVCLTDAGIEVAEQSIYGPLLATEIENNEQQQ